MSTVAPTFADSSSHSKDSTVELNRTLERIWNEYPDGFLDIKEADIAAKPQEDNALVPDENLEDEPDAGPSGMMKWEDMAKLRESVGVQLK